MVEYFNFWYHLFVPWDEYNTVWVILGLIIFLNKINIGEEFEQYPLTNFVTNGNGQLIKTYDDVTNIDS